MPKLGGADNRFGDYPMPMLRLRQFAFSVQFTDRQTQSSPDQQQKFRSVAVPAQMPNPAKETRVPEELSPPFFRLLSAAVCPVQCTPLLSCSCSSSALVLFQSLPAGR